MHLFPFLFFFGFRLLFIMILLNVLLHPWEMMDTEFPHVTPCISTMACCCGDGIVFFLVVQEGHMMRVHPCQYLVFFFKPSMRVHVVQLHFHNALPPLLQLMAH